MASFGHLKTHRASCRNACVNSQSWVRLKRIFSKGTDQSLDWSTQTVWPFPQTSITLIWLKVTSWRRQLIVESQILRLRVELRPNNPRKGYQLPVSRKWNIYLKHNLKEMFLSLLSNFSTAALGIICRSLKQCDISCSSSQIWKTEKTERIRMRRQRQSTWGPLSSSVVKQLMIFDENQLLQCEHLKQSHTLIELVWSIISHLHKMISATLKHVSDFWLFLRKKKKKKIQVLSERK